MPWSKIASVMVIAFPRRSSGMPRKVSRLHISTINYHFLIETSDVSAISNEKAGDDCAFCRVPSRMVSPRAPA